MRVKELVALALVRRPGWLLPWLIAVTIGAALTVLAVLLFYRTGGLRAAAPPVQLTGTELQLVSGQGERTPAGVAIRHPGPDGVATAQGMVERLVQAKLFRRLSWQVEGLEPGNELRLIWVTLAEPHTRRERLLPAVNEGTVDLGAEPHWQGRIAAVGLTMRSAFSSPITIRQLELQPARLTVGELWRWAVSEWRAFEDWSQRSINYASGAPLDALFPPVLIVALWLGFSGVLYAFFSPPRGQPRTLMPYAALFLLGWLLLDLRWQWELNQRLGQTVARFAGKEMTERRLADLDGDFYRFLLEVRRRLPEKPVRLFIVSNDPSGFLAGRARYHLSPHNGYMGFTHPPAPDRAHEGHYVLILSPLSGVRYSRQEQALEWENGRLLVEMRYSAPLGALFRVREG
ncbi:MAG: hypothetical protein WAW42_17445 [Candidatus Competibacteraceae bacterium]